METNQQDYVWLLVSLADEEEGTMDSCRVWSWSSETRHAVVRQVGRWEVLRKWVVVFNMLSLR